jgi:hypothetical protein
MMRTTKEKHIVFVSVGISILLIACSAGATNQSNAHSIQNNPLLLTTSPLLASTFLGGSDNDGMYYTDVNIVQDAQGNIFIAGTTESSDFPVTPNVHSIQHNGNLDVFVTKMNNDLTTVLASTYIGGTNNEEARGIQIDQNGNIFICGITTSTDFFSTTNAFQTEYHGGTESPYGSGDAFIIKMNNDLTEAISSTFLGGKGHEYCNGIVIDSQGNVIVTGGTSSVDFPMAEHAFDRNHHTGGTFGDDVYIAKVSNDLSTLLSSTYLGGNDDDFSEGILVDDSDNIYVTGWIRSSGFPTTEQAYDTTFGGGYFDGFVSRFDKDLSTLQSSTFLGGSRWDFCYAITIDAEENIYVTGHTASTNYPVSTTAFCKNYQGIGGQDIGDDVFVSKLDADLSILSASTYLGGDYWENGYSIITSKNNMIYIAGTTSSHDFPMTSDSFSPTYHDGSKYKGDSFISCLTNDLSLLASSTYLGEDGEEETGQLFEDPLGRIVIVGSTSSLDFPMTEGCYDPNHNGMYDVYIAKFNQGLSTNEPPEKPEISGPSAGKSGQTYEYTAVTSDYDNDHVYYRFDWGYENVTNWLGPFNSGDSCKASYSWSEKGSYSIKVKARDTAGFESEWSDPLPVSMPKNRIFAFLFDRYLDTQYTIFNFLNFFGE